MIRLSLLILLSLALLPARATPPAVVAPVCLVPPSAQFSMSTTRAIAAGETLLVVIATDSFQLEATTVRIGTQPFAPVASANRVRRNDHSMLMFSQRFATTQAISSSLQVQFGRSQPDTIVCVQAYALPDVDIERVRVFQTQARGRAADAISLIPPSSPLDASVFLAVAFAGAPGVLTSDLDASARVCDAGSNLCLAVFDSDLLVDLSPLTVTAGLPQDWSATLLALADPRLFADGFE